MKAQPKLRFVIILCMCGILSISCATIEESTGISQKTMGRILGGVAGGVVGSAVGDNEVRAVAILLGTAGGAWLGGKIAESLSEEDKKDSEETIAKTLETAEDDEKVVWQSETSSANGEFSAGEVRTETRQVAVARDTRVEELPPLKLLNQQYTALKVSNVRSRPSTQAKRVGSLAAGENFTAVGKVVGAEWIMVAKNNVSVGYVYAQLVEPSQTTVAREEPRVRPAVNLDEMEDADNEPQAVEGVGMGGVDLDAMVVADTMEVTTECRTLEYDLTNDEQETETGEFEACRGADGAWEI